MNIRDVIGMDKPMITTEQVEAIEEIIMKRGRDYLLNNHAFNEKDWSGAWSCLNSLTMDTICRHLYAPHTVEIQKTVDEQLNSLYENPVTLSGSNFDDINGVVGFRHGMQSALRIIGRQTPGVITWEE